MKPTSQKNTKKKLLTFNKANDEALTAGININLPNNFFLKLGLSVSITAITIILMLIIRDYLKKI